MAVPRGNGTGPEGRGPATGRGLGSCTGYLRTHPGSRPGRSVPLPWDRVLFGLVPKLTYLLKYSEERRRQHNART